MEILTATEIDERWRQASERLKPLIKARNDCYNRMLECAAEELVKRLTQTKYH